MKAKSTPDDKLKLSTSPPTGTQSLSTSPLSPASRRGTLPLPGHRRSPSNNDVALGSGGVPFISGVKKPRVPKRSLITIDKQGTIISCNQAARDLFGYAVGTLMRQNVRVLMPEPHASKHQEYIDRYLASGKSSGAIGAWKERPAVRRDGEPFFIRVALSPTSHEGETVFSALIEPLYECEIKTDDKDVVVSVAGSPIIMFGFGRDDLIGSKVEKVLREGTDWRRKLDKNVERVVLCRNVDGEEFAVSLKTRKEGQFIVGKFTEAPALKMKITMNKNGIIEDCVGDSKALLGYKHSSLKGMRLDDLLEDEDIAQIVLDKKIVISVKHRDGRTVFASLRVTTNRLKDGTMLFEGSLKRHERQTNMLKSKRLRYGGAVFGWYEMGPSLGHGMCGPVKRAVHRLTGEEVAIKTLSRERFRELNMIFPPQEIRLLERVRHPNLMRMLDVLWTEDDIYLVLELIDGGEFFEYCSAAGRLTEVQARVFWRQLLSGVDYLHRSMICHRDVKLENLCMDGNHNIKLVDFGFATSFYVGEKMTTFCGSPDYAAPELIDSRPYFGPDVDIWACGCVLYVMLTGFIPFANPTRCLELKWRFPPDMEASPGVQMLLKAVFQAAPNRASMEALLKDAWTCEGFAEPVKRVEPMLGRPHEEVDEAILEEMEEHYGWHRDAIISALSAHHTPSQIATTYHLLEYKKSCASLPKNPIWSAPQGAATGRKKKPNACVIA